MTERSSGKKIRLPKEGAVTLFRFPAGWVSGLMGGIGFFQASIFLLSILLSPCVCFSWTENYQWPAKQVTIDISGATGTIGGDSYKNIAITSMNNWFTYCSPRADFAFYNTDPVSACTYNVRDSRNCTAWAALGSCSGTFTVGQTMMWLSGDNLLEADVALNSQCNSTGYWTYTRALAALSHEYGHVIGLGHSSDVSALMYPYLRDSIWYPQADDCTGFYQTYSSSLSFETDADAVTVPEGGTASFRVRLGGPPSSNVVASVSRSSGDSSISVVSGSSLTFTPSNWNVYQTVTLGAAEDEDTVNGSAEIRINAAGVNSKYVTANELDNDAISTVPSDFDRDGDPDILWWHGGRGEVVLWYMNGASPVSSQYITAVSDTNWKIVGVGDFNRDGHPDILWWHGGRGEVVLWYMNGASPVSSQYITAVPDTNWRIVGVGDFSRDGNLDILWQHQSRGEVVLWRMNGATPVSAQGIATVANTDWKIVGVGDFDQDGDPDILWWHQGNGSVALWYMNGETPVSAQGIATVADTGWTIMGVADFDRNGYPDILWWHQTKGEIALWYTNGANPTSSQGVATVPDVNWKIVAP